MENHFNNPLSRIQMTRTQLNGKIEALISFDGEPASWVSIETINGMYSYMKKFFSTLYGNKLTKET